MGDPASRVKPPAGERHFGTDRVAEFLKIVKAMAAGRLDLRLAVSPEHDELDAIACAINVMVGELGWADARATEAEQQKAAQLRATAASAEARNSAILTALPDLMFILLRDGTFVDYHARDSGSLFVPPDEFIGRTVREVMPPALAETMMTAIEDAWGRTDPVVVEYELPMSEPRNFEARMVQASADSVLCIVRDITELKRASALNRDLARRLIDSQEVERQRIARELHDDISQRMAALSIEVDQVAMQADSERLRARLRQWSTRASEVARDAHRMSYELHPSKLQTIGLVAALRSLCSDVSKQRKVHVSFTHHAVPPSTDAYVSLCLYRIVQEGLQNVVRHSQAETAEVDVSCIENQIVLEIADSGVGFDPKQIPHAGLGLVSMQERVAALDGRLKVDTAPGRGTRITVQLPRAC